MLLPNGPKLVCSEFVKLRKYKRKLIKMPAFGRIISPTYEESADVSHQNWNPTIRSIWLLVGRVFMSIYSLVNFTFKSPARINLFTFWTTFTEQFCAIRIMFSVVLRAAFRCSISQSSRLLPNGPKLVFSEFVKRRKYKRKLIKMSALGPIISPKY